MTFPFSNPADELFLHVTFYFPLLLSPLPLLLSNKDTENLNNGTSFNVMQNIVSSETPQNYIIVHAFSL